MPTPGTSRRVLLIIAVACVVVRLFFVFSVEPIPVMWDARIYASAAVGLNHAVFEGGEFGHPERQSPADSTINRSLFLNSMEQNIRGERIEWLYYGTPTLAEAQNYLFLSGPVYPAWLALVFLQNIGSDFTVVRVLNCFLDGLCVLLLMLIALRLFGRGAAVVAGVLYVLYLPFTLLCGLISPDQLTILLILAAVYSITTWYDDRKSRRVYLTGLFLGLLVLTRPTATLLCVPFLAGFFFDMRGELKTALLMTLRALLPFVAVVLPWVLVTTAYFGELAVRDPEYSAANFRSSSSIKHEGYDLDYTERDFWLYSVGHTIAENPVGYAHLLVKKFIRLWSQPYNDFAQSFILSPAPARVFHLVVVLFGLFGAFLFARYPRPGPVYLLLIPLYYTLVHVVFHALARYNLNAMSLIMIAASGAMVYGHNYLSRQRISFERVSIMLKLAAIATGLLFVFVFPVGVGASWFGGVFGVAVVLVLKALVIVGLFLFLGRLARSHGANIASIRVMSIPTMLLLVVILVAGGASDSWAEWKCRLDRPEQRAGVRIYIPEDFRLQPNELVRIGIDVTAAARRRNLFHITVGGKQLTGLAGRPPLTDFYYKKMTYPVFESLRGIEREEMRFWSFILVDPETFNILADRDGYISVELSASDSLYYDGGYIELFGDYRVADVGHAFIPDLNYSSIERFVEKGDPRIPVDYELCSDSVVAYYSDDARTGGVDRDDLSPSPGRQSGRYRIYIEVMRLNRDKYHL